MKQRKLKVEWKLICNWTGDIIATGTELNDFRNVPVKIAAVFPPSKPSFGAGKVEIHYSDLDKRLVFPSVVNCRFEKRTI